MSEIFWFYLLFADNNPTEYGQNLMAILFKFSVLIGLAIYAYFLIKSVIKDKAKSK